MFSTFVWGSVSGYRKVVVVHEKYAIIYIMREDLRFESGSENEGGRPLSRRDFLKWLAAFGAGVAGSEAVQAEEEPALPKDVEIDPAARQKAIKHALSVFSAGNAAKIHGVGKIEQAVLPKAPCGVIVYIRQIHDFPGRSMTYREYERPDFEELKRGIQTKRMLLDLLGQPSYYLEKEEGVEKNIETMKEVQKNIYMVIMRAIQDFKITDVYTEGVADEGIVEKLWQEHREIRGKILREENEEQRKKLREEARKLEATITSGMLAVVFLSRNRNIKVRPTENKEINTQAFKAIHEDDRKKFQEFALRKREDFAIASIAGNKPVIAPLIFGGGHEKGMMRAVQEYNSAHPKEPYALVVVTPLRYPEEK